MINPLAQLAPSGHWHQLATRVLEGHRLGGDEALAVLQAPDEELLELLSAAYQVRRHYFGNKVQLYFLINAKSGLCPEDCHYCSQSRLSQAPVAQYPLLDEATLLDGARAAWQRGAKTYCIVISGRGPSEQELQAIEQVVPKIKQRLPLKICACLGLLDFHQARRLKACGVDRVNHNLNTSRSFYQQICTTHTYEDRLATLQAVKAAGLEICCGGIVGMGEQPQQVVEMALELQALQAHSIPVNFLHPVPGTPLENCWKLNPRYCLKVLCMFRLTNPRSEIRIAGGRELHLRSLQPLGLFAANSIFVGDYLTTRGQPPEEDLAMIRDLGFEVECIPSDEPSSQPNPPAPSPTDPS